MWRPWNGNENCQAFCQLEVGEDGEKNIETTTPKAVTGTGKKVEVREVGEEDERLTWLCSF